MPRTIQMGNSLKWCVRAKRKMTVYDFYTDFSASERRKKKLSKVKDWARWSVFLSGCAIFPVAFNGRRTDISQLRWLCALAHPKFGQRPPTKKKRPLSTSLKWARAQINEKKRDRTTHDQKESERKELMSENYYTGSFEFVELAKIQWTPNDQRVKSATSGVWWRLLVVMVNWRRNQIKFHPKQFKIDMWPNNIWAKIPSSIQKSNVTEFK